MRLAGIGIPDTVILELAVLLRRGGFTDTAETLEGAVAANQLDIALTILEREAIISVLDDPPTRLVQRDRPAGRLRFVGSLRRALASLVVGRRRSCLVPPTLPAALHLPALLRLPGLRT
jgi:hypothetical protein